MCAAEERVNNLSAISDVAPAKNEGKNNNEEAGERGDEEVRATVKRTERESSLAQYV